jgi:hypothetical protein
MGNLRERIAQSLKASRGFAQANAGSILTGLGTGAATYALTGLGKNKGKNRLTRALLAGVAGTGAGFGAYRLKVARRLVNDYLYQQRLRREIMQALALWSSNKGNVSVKPAKQTRNNVAAKNSITNAIVNQPGYPQDDNAAIINAIVNQYKYSPQTQAATADAFAMSSDPAQRYTTETLAQANKGQSSTGTGNAVGPANLAYSDIIAQIEGADKMQREQYKNENRARAPKSILLNSQSMADPNYDILRAINGQYK